jgi:hypothetical protein
MQQMRSIQISLVLKLFSRATNANNSNFFGFKAGNVATNADNSNFFGQILVAQQMHMGQIS